MPRSRSWPPKRQGIADQLALPLVKKTTFTLPRDLYRRLKIESARREVEMSSIVADALRNFLLKGPNEP
jgi:hypothetical protein